MSSSLTRAAPAAELSRSSAFPGPVLLRFVGSMAFALVLLAFLWGRTINHDGAWYLISTRKWLAGARFYVDLYDVNPPLASVLTVPAIWIADAFAISDTNGLYAFLCALTGVSLFLSASILDARIGPGAARKVVAFLGLGATLTLPSLKEFGQREQLMVLLVLPWFLSQLPAPAGETPRPVQRVLLAVAAAIGICIKPYFLTIPIAVVAWQMLARRSLRPLATVETIAMVLTGLAYVAATALLFPQFFSDIIPTARQAYLSFGFSNRVAALRLAVGVLPYLAFFILLAGNWRNAAMPGLLVAGIIAGLSSYLLQWNGFDYHLVPFWTFADLAVVWALVQAPRARPLFLGTILTAAAVMGQAAQDGTYEFRAWPYIQAAMGDAPVPRSLFAATTSVDAGPLLAIELGADWASRFPAHWTLPGPLDGLAATDCTKDPATCAGFRALLDRTRDADLDDITTFRPDMILIDKRRIFIADPDFSWYDFFAADPRWPALIGAYRRAGSTGFFDIWTLRTGAN